jgi:hypothetical protein
VCELIVFVDCEKNDKVRNPQKEVVLPSIFDNNHFSLDFFFSLLLLSEEEEEEDDELPDEELEDDEEE